MKGRPGPGTEAAHPLVPLLLRRLKPGERLLLLGAGSGRNVPPFLAAGVRVVAVEPDERRRTALAVRCADGAASGMLRLETSLRDVAARSDFEACAALLATHALLHGTPGDIAGRFAEASRLLRPGATISATFGSRRDPRFGRGTRIDDATWAPADGDEAGVPHAYFARADLAELLRGVDVETLSEDSAAESAGAWAHTEDEAATMRHWFAIARTRTGAYGVS